jgi:hypothetical protein
MMLGDLLPCHNYATPPHESEHFFENGRNQRKARSPTGKQTHTTSFKLSRDLGCSEFRYQLLALRAARRPQAGSP